MPRRHRSVPGANLHYETRIADLERQLAEAKQEVESEKASHFRSMTRWRNEENRLREELEKYGKHLNDGKHPMCEILKHSDYGCTCGLDKALACDGGQEEK